MCAFLLRACGPKGRSTGREGPHIARFQFTGFTEKANAVLNRAVAFAAGEGHTYIGTEHLLWALCGAQSGAAGHVLLRRGVTANAVEEKIRQTVGAGLPTVLTQSDFTPRLSALLGTALAEARKEELGAGTGHLLRALLREKRCAALEILSALGVSPALLGQELEAGLRGAQALLGAGNEKKHGRQTLEKYAVDLTALAEEGKLDPVVCRDAEIARTQRILCKIGTDT